METVAILVCVTLLLLWVWCALRLGKIADEARAEALEKEKGRRKQKAGETLKGGGHVQ